MARPRPRQFLQQSVAGAAATSSALSAPTAVSASSHDRIAGASRRVRVALCDVDDEPTVKTKA